MSGLADATETVAQQLAEFIRQNHHGCMPANGMNLFYAEKPHAKEIIKGKLKAFCDAHSHVLVFEISTGCGLVHAKRRSARAKNPSVCTPDSHLYKTTLCTFHSKGVCPRGPACTFAHGVEDLAKPTSAAATGLGRHEESLPFSSIHDPQAKAEHAEALRSFVEERVGKATASSAARFYEENAGVQALREKLAGFSEAHEHRQHFPSGTGGEEHDTLLPGAIEVAGITRQSQGVQADEATAEKMRTCSLGTVVSSVLSNTEGAWAKHLAEARTTMELAFGQRHRALELAEQQLQAVARSEWQRLSEREAALQAWEGRLVAREAALKTAGHLGEEVSSKAAELEAERSGPRDSSKRTAATSGAPKQRPARPLLKPPAGEDGWKQYQLEEGKGHWWHHEATGRWFMVGDSKISQAPPGI